MGERYCFYLWFKKAAFSNWNLQDRDRFLENVRGPSFDNKDLFGTLPCLKGIEKGNL